MIYPEVNNSHHFFSNCQHSQPLGCLQIASKISDIGLNIMGTIGLINVFLNNCLRRVARTYGTQNAFILFNISYFLGLANSIYLSLGYYVSEDSEKKAFNRISDVLTRVAGIWQNLLFLSVLISNGRLHASTTYDLIANSYHLGYANSIYSVIYVVFYNIKRYFI